MADKLVMETGEGDGLIRCTLFTNGADIEKGEVKISLTYQETMNLHKFFKMAIDFKE